MKILHVVYSINKEDGGVPQYALSLAKKQNDLGLNASICCVDDYLHTNFTKKELSNFIKKIYIFKISFLKIIRFSFGFKKFIDNNIHKYDLLHIHGLYRFPQSYAAYIARKFNINYIISPHGALDPYLFKKSKYSLFFKKIWEFLIDVPNIKHASGIHCTSEVEKKKIKLLFPYQKFFVVYNFIDDIFFKKNNLNNITKYTKKFSRKDKIILFLGRINFKKGLDILIPAFKKVNIRYPNYKLLLVGPNKDKYLEKVIIPLVKEYNLKNNFFYHPGVYGKSIIQCYNKASLFVLPSYTENFGLSIFEAMSCKIPVIVSDQIDLFSTIKKYKLGLICKCNVNSLYKKIIFSIKNNKEINYNKINSFNFVKENYQSKKIINDFKNLYIKVILSKNTNFNFKITN